MKKLNIYFIIWIVLMSFLEGSMYSDLGEHRDAYVVDWGMLVGSFFLFGGMFFLGYLSRSEDE